MILVYSSSIKVMLKQELGVFKVQDTVSVHNGRNVMGHNLRVSLHFLVMLSPLVSG